METSTRRMPALDANLIPVLHALMRHESVTRAGEELGLTQSATSHALARLRAFFDDPLLVRDGASMRKTPKALTLEAAVRRAAAAQLDLASRGPGGFQPGVELGAVQLWAPADLWIAAAPGLVQRLAARAPNVRVAAAVAPGAADLVVRPSGPGRPLLDGAWIRVGPPAGPAAAVAGWPTVDDDGAAHRVPDPGALLALLLAGATAVVPDHLAAAWGLPATGATDAPARRLWLEVPETAPPLHRWVAEQLRQTVAALPSAG